MISNTAEEGLKKMGPQQETIPPLSYSAVSDSLLRFVSVYKKIPVYKVVSTVS